MSKRTVISGLLASLASAALLFQNCGRPTGFDLLYEEGGSLDLALTHPVTTPQPASSQKTLLVGREYVTGLMREIFTSASHPIAELETLLYTWSDSRGPQMGGACNPYDTYSSVDCQSDRTAAVGAPYQDTSTLREAFRLQLCQNILGSEGSVPAALEKIDLHPGVEPTPTHIQSAVSLFYRAQTLEPLFYQSLVELDRELQLGGESPAERWRGLLLMICESPGWQLL